MVDKPTVHIGENSAEHVAYKLMSAIAAAEQKRIVGVTAGETIADRQYILDLYAECLTATKGHR